MLRPALCLALAASLAGCERAAPARLVVALPVGLHSRDIHDPAVEEFGTSILSNVYETLVDIEPDLGVRPGLAEAWRSPDDRTWIFTLRKGVHFSDGRPLTAAGVVAAFDEARERNAWLRGELEPIVAARAQGNREVVFETRRHFAALPARLGFLYVSAAVPGAPAVGTGPYRIRAWTPAGSTFLEAVPGSLPAGAPPHVEFRTVKDARERADLLLQGEVHLITDVRPEDLGRLRGASGVRAIERPGLRLVFLGMDCARAATPYVTPLGNPFRDPLVREAIALAVDRDALVAGALGGHGKPAAQLALPFEVGHDPALPDQPPDAAAARGLLARAGFPKGFDVALDYIPGKYLAIDAVVQAVTQQLAAVGVRARPRALESAEFMQRIEARDTSMYVLGWLNETGSAHETYASLLHSPAAGLGATNGGGFSSPRLDELLAAYADEPEAARQVELLQEATRLVADEHPVIPLYRQNDLYAVGAGLRWDPPLHRRILASRMRWQG